MSLPRRAFLLSLAGGAAGLGAWWVARSWPIATPSGESRPVRSPVTRTARALGAEMSITALHEDALRAAQAIDAAFAAIDEVEAVMSLYRPTSQLCLLNRTGVVANPDGRFVEVLSLAQDIAARSRGKFDITIQPLWKLHADSARAGRAPSEAELTFARELVDWRKLAISPRELRLHRRSMAVTLNGIAQGYAADRALAALRQHGIEHALVNSGEMGSLGQSARGDRWGVGIQHPRAADSYVAIADLDGRCLATSGDYATTFDGDPARHHLLDPATGRSAGEFSSVSVVAPTGMLADALSTAVFVMGVEAGRELVASLPGCDLFAVKSNGTTVMTPGFPLRRGAEAVG